MSFWECPKCETLNNDNFCQGCGAPRPVTQTSVPAVDKKSNKGLLIALVVIVAVILIVLTAFVGYMFLGRGDDVAEETAVQGDTVPVDTNIYYVNKFDDSGIYVREGPGKGYDDVLYIKKGDQSVKLLYLGEKVMGGDNWLWYLVETPSGKIGYVREDVVVEFGKGE